MALGIGIRYLVSYTVFNKKNAIVKGRSKGPDPYAAQSTPIKWHKGGDWITANTALRLGRFFGTGERFWLNLQQAYDIECAKAGLGRRLLREVEPLVA
jgi:hypothetical protein